MNRDYEQLNIGTSDNLGNPFSRTRKGGFNEIMRNKNRYGKYIFIFVACLFIIILCIFLASKSSQLSTLKQENTNLNEQLSQISAQEHDLKQQHTQLTAEKTNLSKQNADLTTSIQDYEAKNRQLEEENKANAGNVESIKQQLSATNDKINELTALNEKANKEIASMELNTKTYALEIDELQNKIKELESKIASGGGSSNIPIYNPGGLTTSIDSKIITSSDQVRLLMNWINKGNDYSFKLIYRATQMGYSAQKFHEAVDGVSHTVTLINDQRGFIIGGYTSQSWTSERGFRADMEAFIFNLSSQRVYPVRDPEQAIYCDPQYLAIFGKKDISLEPDSAKTAFPYSYGNRVDEFELTNGNPNILPTEVEVFTLRPN